MLISDWGSDVCSSDLQAEGGARGEAHARLVDQPLGKADAVLLPRHAEEQVDGAFRPGQREAGQARQPVADDVPPDAAALAQSVARTPARPQPGHRARLREGGEAQDARATIREKA